MYCKDENQIPINSDFSKENSDNANFSDNFDISDVRKKKSVNQQVGVE